MPSKREHQAVASTVASGRWWLGVMLALVLSMSVSACGAVREGSGQASNRIESIPSTASGGAVTDDNISPLLLSNFPLLRTPRDGLPLAIRQRLRVPFAGMKWNLARRIPTSLPGGHWLAPGVNRLCIVAVSPDSRSIGTVCGIVNQALRRGIANTSVNPVSRRRVIVGVAPQGTHAVLLQSGAETISVRVRHGRFVLRDAVLSPPDQLTLR